MAGLYFAQISDIHISTRGDMYDMLSGHSAGFLAAAVARLNRQPDLDFVLITGDLLTEGLSAEFDRFQRAIHKLQKPCYVIPGNHDHHNAGSGNGLSRLEFARYFNPQLSDRLESGDDQPGYWSLAVKPDVQLIGLDSIRDEDWGGRVNPAQLAWLEAELSRHAGKLVMVAVHHPLHRLSPIDHRPEWQNFVCDNGPELLALFNRHPQVKVVLTAHHHLTKADTLNGRLHLACPALAVYPCAYRTLRLTPLPGRRWRVAWQTHPATAGATVAKARRLMAQNWTENAGLPPDFVEAYIRQAWGLPEDRAGEQIV